MRKHWLPIILISAIALGAMACFPYAGQQYYARAPRFEPTHPSQVRLLRSEPRRPHIQLGEVWIRPDPGMSPNYVENTLKSRAAALGANALVIVEDRYFKQNVVRSYWHGRRYYRDRVIVGVAIRYR
ncbi:MAG: hypothetical protein A2Y56_08930 [Candidatus Aminicenantes bacterium RBG_13_63_10]|nr:MAG: hypothetical protein A2Y56_08930 [Candidatus Aminicenantes bacterium RBG_13_63_10]